MDSPYPEQQTRQAAGDVCLHHIEIRRDSQIVVQ